MDRVNINSKHSSAGVRERLAALFLAKSQACGSLLLVSPGTRSARRAKQPSCWIHAASIAVGGGDTS
ncbi:MAG: hypothetical protein EAZ60_16425 [Oscillatoriales cyanobacterium]|nr:MAG: hypothetical protein EAZ83_30625 [Oscillatoriales cyanobacterium]TAE99324.1 MAG: hypothetical protein EAZ79_05585 [Oscillatoriales cyanobacterium]TAF13326.1 MAG: hypothetical protein EAZ73_30375 [Oscillatoriales cyanobacterium]TAF26146.1 MAG: hypothetical protein EAZ69_29460 [Oscillatoriales cyanobacterium]TAF54507.1 MAG: hypothetical protein EAZ60_16425 [Oscillatoriales cyanobacterium]